MTDQPPANKQAIITEASASDVGGFGYFPEWGELSGSIIGAGMEKIWAGEIDAETGWRRSACRSISSWPTTAIPSKLRIKRLEIKRLEIGVRGEDAVSLPNLTISNLNCPSPL
jgi:hypothetical protein